MPLSRNDQRTKNTLQAAAEYLRTAGEEDYAATVSSILTPTGYAFVQRLNADRTPSNLTITLPDAERAHFYQAAEETGESLSYVGDEALHRIIEGEFRPAKYVRPSARLAGGGDERSLVLSVDKRLKDQVSDLLKDPSFVKKLGWKPRSTAALVRMFLQARYPLFEGVDTAEVVRAHEDGTSTDDLVEQFGISPHALALLLEPRRGLAANDVAEVVRRYKAGEGTYVLAREFGVPPTTVIRALDKAGIKRRPTRGKAPAGD